MFVNLVTSATFLYYLFDGCTYYLFNCDKNLAEKKADDIIRLERESIVEEGKEMSNSSYASNIVIVFNDHCESK